MLESHRVRERASKRSSKDILKKFRTVSQVHTEFKLIQAQVVGDFCTRGLLLVLCEGSDVLLELIDIHAKPLTARC